MSATAQPDTGVSTWTIDAAHTTVEFSVKHLLITTVKGAFGAVSGTVTLDANNPAASTADVTIETTSITTHQEQRDEHLRSADFFDVANFPTMHFVSKRVESKGDGEYLVVGDLTIRGTTREVTLSASDEGRARDPWGRDKAAFTAKTKISRGEFGLTWNQVLEAGGVAVSDEVKISLDVSLVKSAE